MNGVWQRLPELLRPVPDAALPLLLGRMTRGVRAISLVAMIISPTFGVLGWASGMSEALEATVFSLIYTAGFVFTYWLADPERHRVPPQVAVFICMLFATLGTTLAGHTVLEMSSLTMFGVVLPVIASGFFPWSPRWSLLLGTITMGIQLVAVPQYIIIPTSLYLLLGCTYMVLAAAANQLHRRLWLELECAQQRLVAFDRMSTLGRMAAGIAHELKTPTAAAANSLAHIRALAGELMESIGHADVTDEDMREITREMENSSELALRAITRSGRFLQAIRNQTLGMNQTEVVEFDAGQHVASCVTLLEYRARRAGLRLEAPQSKVLVRGDPGKFEQVITNLIANGIEACSETGKGTAVRVEIHREKSGVAITVEDDGPGIVPEIADRIFDSMFTTRATTGGTGLGLSISRNIVEGVFGGTLGLVKVDRGTKFEFKIPDGGARAGASLAFTPGSRVEA